MHAYRQTYIGRYRQIDTGKTSARKTALSRSVRRGTCFRIPSHLGRSAPKLSKCMQPSDPANMGATGTAFGFAKRQKYGRLTSVTALSCKYRCVFRNLCVLKIILRSLLVCVVLAFWLLLAIAFFLAVKSWKPTGSQPIALTMLFKYFLFQRSRCFLLLF